ncbi:MAG TPA: hypothetical protein VIV60_28700 [Polyangiaceae bacterium]
MTFQPPLLAGDPGTRLTTSPSTSSAPALTSLGQGALLCASYGVALSIGTDKGHVLGLALAVPFTFAASIALAIPSLFVVLALLEAPMELADLVDYAVRAFRNCARVLGGLAPTVLLLSTSIADRHLVHLIGYGGLVLAAALGAYRIMSDAREALRTAAALPQLRHTLVLFAFVGLSFEIAARFWAASLNLFGGLS